MASFKFSGGQINPEKNRSAILVFLGFISFFISASSLFAQERLPSLAILDVTPIKVADDKALVVYGYIVDQVHRSGQYEIVERKEIEKAIKEMEFSMSDLVDDKTAVRIGRMTGAHYILISSLQLEDNTYYLSMRVIGVEAGTVIQTSMKNTSDFGRIENLVRESVASLLGSTIDRTKEPFYMTAGVSVGLPLPVGAAADFLTLTVEPGVSYNLVFTFSWGKIAVGLAAAFDYYGVKDQSAAYVMNIPLLVRANYILPLGILHIFAGAKGGLVICNYQAVIYTEPKTGLLPYLSPEAGVGITIAGWLGFSVGVGFDMIFFPDGAMHMNINPFVQTSVAF